MSADSPSWPNPSQTENTLFYSMSKEKAALLLSILSQGPQSENGCFLLPTTTSCFLAVCKRTYG